MKRSATLAKVAVLAALVGSIACGSAALYLYTLPPASASAQGVASSPIGEGATSQAPVAGGTITVVYNGTSYTVPAKGPNSPTFGCPPGTAPSLCTLLQETCGNGVGPLKEPWKTCYNCVFDAGCSGDNSCDPYTHECSSPASACQIIAGGYNQAG